MNIYNIKQSFEKSFQEKNYYNNQTQDKEHLENIINFLKINSNIKILDLGCGSGYLTFEIAKRFPNVEIIGLDIVTNTLNENIKIANDLNLNNISFKSYDGLKFPFDNFEFDLVVTRYALHHFQMINESIKEVSRVLKCNGLFFLSDPRPNECDNSRFVDDYMKLKNDGHNKFYLKNEWINICLNNNLKFVDSFDSKITFPRKKEESINYKDVLLKHDKKIIESYNFYETLDELYITEEVNNMIFIKL